METTQEWDYSLCKKCMLIKGSGLAFNQEAGPASLLPSTTYTRQGTESRQVSPGKTNDSGQGLIALALTGKHGQVMHLQISEHGREVMG